MILAGFNNQKIGYTQAGQDIEVLAAYQITQYTDAL